MPTKETEAMGERATYFGEPTPWQLRGRGCTCADAAYLPDPNCPECGPRRQREAEQIGYGP